MRYHCAEASAKGPQLLEVRRSFFCSLRELLEAQKKQIQRLSQGLEASEQQFLGQIGALKKMKASLESH